MRITYAVSWEEPDGARHSGRLELGADALTLEGRADGAGTRRVLRYDDLAGFRLARANGERLQGRPTLILELAGERLIRIASVAQPGIVGELAERLGGLAETREPPARIALVVPLRPGAREEAEALLFEGPPFDPAALGLESHDVYVTDDEVVFVFEGVASAFVERLAADAAIWDAAEGWRPLIAGPIRYADQAYAWAG
jgi:hypothetical protein